MARLIDLAQVLRSKNAGPLFVTFDIMFDSCQPFNRVVESGVLTPQLIGDLYSVEPADVEITVYEIVTSIKITIPRKQISGSLADNDVYGCQQQLKLSEVIIP